MSNEIFEIYFKQNKKLLSKLEEEKIKKIIEEEFSNLEEQNFDWSGHMDTMKKMQAKSAARAAADRAAGKGGSLVDRIKGFFSDKVELPDIRDLPLKDKCAHCLKPENMQSPECQEWLASEPGGIAGAMARCEQTPTTGMYKSKKRIRKGCWSCLGGSGSAVLNQELSKIGVKRVPQKIRMKMLQNLLNYVNPGLPGYGKQGRLVVDGVCGNKTRGAIQFFQEKTSGMKIDQCAGGSVVRALLRQYYKKHKGSNVSYLYRDSSRGKGTTIDSKGEILPTFGSMPAQLQGQLKHVEQYLPQMKAPFVVVDDANRRMYIFSNKEAYPGAGPKLLAAMPVITGMHKGDEQKFGYARFFEKFGLLKKWQQLKQKEEETGNSNDVIDFQNKAFNAWLAYINKKGGRVTSSGISDITSTWETKTKKDKKGYGEAVIYIEDPMNPEDSSAIHGTGIKSRLRQLKKASKIFDTDPNNSKVQATIKKVGSYGCINLSPSGLKKFRSLISTEKGGSRLFVLPEDGKTVLNYQDFLDFKKASDGARDKYFKKLAARGITGISAADLLKRVDSSKVEQVDPSDQQAVDAALKRAGVGGASWDEKEPE